MTAHMCRTVTDGCYRCELGKDEAEGARQSLIEDIERALHKADIGKLYIIEAVLDL